jgi:hypothetical protein
MRSSDGYQTFGPVQSVGPTVILPVAIVYRLFGVGLLKGRIVVVIFTLISLLLFYLLSKKLFDRFTAILGIFFLLAAPAVRILIYGREVLGEVPGLAFFLAGWLALIHALESRRLGWTVLTGFLFGAAALSKSQYLLIIPTTLILTGFLDLIYHRQNFWKKFSLMVILILACFLAWQIWQMLYYGMDTYQDNLEKLRQLAAFTSGFHLQTSIDAVRGILGSDTGNFFLFWGFFALGYVIYLAIQRTFKGLILASITIFTILWLLYYTFWIVPWHHYALPAMVMVALMVTNLFTSLARSAVPVIVNYFSQLPSGKTIPTNVILAMGTLVGLLSYGLWAGYNLQQFIRFDVLDKIGSTEGTEIRSLAQMQNPGLVAQYLEQEIPSGSVIETWERELSILTNLTYHYPDQSMLTKTHALRYRNEDTDYLLGEEYFEKIQPDYVVIGWFARSFPIYDMQFIKNTGELIKIIGSEGVQYEVYRMKYK